jgi:hypothetical protein
MIHTHGPWFVDERGRTLLLRGVNLAGSSKVPIGLPTRVRERFFDQRNVSFVGRPFPIEEADEHDTEIFAPISRNHTVIAGKCPMGVMTRTRIGPGSA